MRKILKVVILAGLSFIASRSNAQQNRGSGSSNNADSASDISHVLSTYLNNAVSPLYYGVEHYGYSAKIKGTAYFGSEEWQTGSVVYDNVLYTNLSMKYDLVADEVIVLHPNNYFGVTLSKEKVSAFDIGNQSFIYLPRKNAYSLKPGYYALAASGIVSLLIKETKKIAEEISNEVNSSFVDNKEYYVLQNGESFKINNESALISLFGDKSRRVRDYLKEKDISFKQAKELFITTAVVYYNQLP
jgi:hypothetical protein